jgi:phosphate starvation-inducible PhoH-like protein
LILKREILANSEITITILNVDLLEFYGKNDSKINIIRKAFSDLTITSRGNVIRIVGDKTQAQAAKDVFENMQRSLIEYKELTEQNVLEMVGGSNPFESKLSSVSPGNPENIIVYSKEGAPIKARTKNQKKLVESAEENDIVFAIGPAGTGKTYTAVALAVRELKAKRVKRIILTRPAVEAGENLGFLPGDLKEKIDPFLQPLYDALHDMLTHEKLEQLIASRIIEVAPLAFMRGRTLDNAFIILDEAQNTTESQIKMFLTRFGPSAKCIVTGDLTQIDLPHNQRSGLIRALHLLGDIPGIGVVHLSTEDIVRHRLVKEIVKAYDADDERQKNFKEEKRILAEKEREDREKERNK